MRRPRALKLARKVLTPEQERRRILLRDCINASGLSDVRFAAEELMRPDRTIRRWLDGDNPIGLLVATRLATMRDYQLRRDRETQRRPPIAVSRSVQPIDDEREWEMRAPPAPPRRNIPSTAPRVTVQAGKLGRHPDPKYPMYQGQYWLCSCSRPDRKVSWHRMSLPQCAVCGDARPTP